MKMQLELRDQFAMHMQADDRLVKCVRAMDDKALELFALYPGIEREEHITGVEFTNWAALGSEVAKVTRRLELEARAIARVRYMQADAMLTARAQSAQPAEPVADSDGFIPWGGGRCPVADRVRVDIRCRDGFTDIGWADSFPWGHDGGILDITAYRLAREPV